MDEMGDKEESAKEEAETSDYDVGDSEERVLAAHHRRCG